MIKLISKKVAKAVGLITLTGLSGLMTAQGLNWSLAGPVYNAGRVRNIVIDKADLSGNTIYAGSTSSGVFKTIDGGSNWAPLNDQGTVRNISYMAQGVDNNIYVATGEGFLRPGQMAKAQRGSGLYKLNGSALVQLGDSNSVGAVIYRIACSPVNANIIALASNTGIHISADGGASFSLAPISHTNNLAYGMDVVFDGTGILYCTVGTERSLTSANSIPIKTLVYKSDNSLSNFSDITPTSTFLANTNYGRIELAIAPSNNNIIYASCANKSTNNTNGATLAGLFVSSDGGATWGLMIQGASGHDPLWDGGTIASGDYAHVLVVNPSDPTEIFVGGYGFYLCFNTGGTPPLGVLIQLGSNQLQNTQYYLHENIHDIKLVPGTPNKFYFVTDAGIYRSTDLSASTTATSLPSFQPFYKGLVTGQFNSVSIEQFPLNLDLDTANVNGSYINPAAGFIGGTGGNGLNYFSGTPDVVAEEVNYLNGEVYNAELSKILPDAAIMSISNGNLYRSTDVRSSQPTLMSFNTYSGSLSKIAPVNNSFNVGGTTSGSPFRLWENYGDTAFHGNLDPLIFYNDSLRTLTSIVGLATLTTQSTFTFSAPRPNPAALIDSIVIRTGTVVLPLSDPLVASVATPFNLGKEDVFIKLSNNYTTTNTITIPPITSSLGPVSAVGVTLNALSALDNIKITFTAPPFATYTTPYYPVTATGSNITVPDPSAYYRVFATIFYKYNAGAVVSVVDNNISTQTSTYTAVLTQPLKWSYSSGSLTSYTLAANSNSAVSNPTYVLTSNGINPVTVTQTASPVFTVSPASSVSYSITSYGDYPVSAKTVTYTLVATPSVIPGNNYTFTLLPDNTTHTAISTSTASVLFTVTPTVTTNYTIVQSSDGSTLTNTTYSTINTSTYILNPGNISQSTPNFTITVPVGTPTTTYTINGISSSTATPSTTVSYVLPVRTSTTLGGTTVQFSANNPPIKLPTTTSAKLAMVFNQIGVTRGSIAVVVARAPLALNDALNFVRLSQTGCLTNNPDGTPSTTSTITIDGNPTILQWSNSGTELYYATSNNKLYRVSNINLIMDFSQSSYSGKLNTDIFNYNSATGNPGSASDGVNLNSPYRTTLIGSFTKRITSISLAENDTMLAVTFDDATGGNLVSLCNSRLKTGNSSNITFVSKTTTDLKTTDGKPLKMYCSMMEKHDPKKVFVGTDNGVFYTGDITSTSPTWVNANNNQLPNVQVYDIKQQTMPPDKCYNSGEIYVATYGRGVWTNTDYRSSGDQSYVGIKEFAAKEKNISIYPNPTNGKVTVAFNGVDGESAVINVMDLSGRILKSENMGKLNPGEVTYSFDVNSLNEGVYMVSVSSTQGVKRVTKLIVTK